MSVKTDLYRQFVDASTNQDSSELKRQTYLHVCGLLYAVESVEAVQESLQHELRTAQITNRLYKVDVLAEILNSIELALENEEG